MRLILLTLFCLLSTFSYSQNNDCATAELICGDEDITDNPNGAGEDDFADPDNDPGCIVALESNSAWYYFEIDPLAPPGLQLGFTLSPNGGYGEDYDWALYGPDVDCGNLGSPLRCSSSSAMCDFCPETGMGMGTTDTSEGPGTGDGFVSVIDILPGQGYYLMIDNWLGSNQGFVLTWTDTGAPWLNCDADPPCSVTAIAGNDITICEGNPPFALNGSSTGTNGTESYTWTGTNGGTAYLDNPNSQNPNVNLPPGFSGTITYTLTVTQDACVEMDDMILTVNPLPLVTLDPAGPLCETDGPTFLNESPPGGTWTGAPGGIFDPGLNGPGTYPVTYSFTDNNGCSNSESIEIIVNENPTVSISPDPAEFCTSDGGIVLTATGAGGLPGYTYQWTTPNGNASGPTHVATVPGFYFVVVTDNNGCQGNISVDVFENPNPLVTTIDPGPICENEPIFILNAAPSGGSWTGPFVLPDGTIFPIDIGPSNFNVTYTYTDNNGCSSSDDLAVNIIASPASFPSNNGPYCAGEIIELFGNTDGTGNQITWSWTGPNGYTSDEQNPMDATDAGPYVLQVIIDGCESDFQATIVELTPPPDALATNNGPYCPGQAISLFGETTTNGNVITYSWTGPGAYTSDVQNPTDATEEGIYNLQIIVDGCEADPVSTEVLFSAAPDASANNSGPLCVGDAIELTSSTNTNGTTITYSWTGPNNYTSDEQNPMDATEAGNYTVIIEVDGCMSDPTETVVVINALPEPVITGIDEFCEGGSETIDAGEYDSYIWDDGTMGQTINVSASGTYSVTVTDDNGCTGVDDINITVNPNPEPTIAGSTSFCTGSSTTLDAGSGYDIYDWSDGTSEQTIEVSVPGDFTVIVTDSNGCTGSATVTVEESSSLNPVISGDLEYCLGDSTLLDAGAGFETYEWSDGTGNQTIIVTSPGDYSVIVTDADGCSGETSVSIIENDLPQISITGNDPICTGETVTLDAGAGFDTYEWSDNTLNQTLDVDAGGPYSVTVTDSNGCSNEASVDVIENPNPSPVITGDQSFCSGEMVTLDAGNYETYEWSDGTDNATLDINQGGTYSVVVTDINGCTGEDQITITEFQLPEPTISGDLEYCAGNNTSISVNEVYDIYDWSNGENSQSVDISAPGDVDVIVTDENGCTATTGVSIIENPNPEPNISGLTSFCTGTSTTLDAGVGFDEYLWSDGIDNQTLVVDVAGTYSVIVTDLNGCTGESSVDITEIPELEPVITGTLSICEGDNSVLDAGTGYDQYLWSNGEMTQTITVDASDDYTVTVSDTQGCTGESTVTFVVNSNPVAQISGDDEICTGDQTTLDANGGLNLSYAWSNGEITPSIDVTTGNIYSVTVTNSNGCTDETSFEVTENPLPIPIITGPISFCTGNTATLDAGAGFDIYEWSNGETTQTVTISNEMTISVIVTDANGCTGTDQVTVTENASLEPAIAGVFEFCEGGNTILDAGTGFETYEWSTGEMSQTITVQDGGSYTVIVTDTDGCSGSDNINVTEFQNPDPTIAGSTTFCTGSFTTLDAGNYESYLWSDGSMTQTIVVNTPGTYTVDVIDINGCAGQASTDVTESTSLSPVISGDQSFCENESTTLDAGAGFATYLWSDGTMGQTLVVNIADDYSVTVSDAQGCTGETTVSITETSPPVAQLSPDTSLCNTTAGGSFLNLYDLVVAGDMNGTWDDADNSGAVGLFDNLNFNNIPAGDYNFIYTTNSAIAPCVEVSYNITITVIDCTCPDVQFFTADPLCNAGDALDLTTIENTMEDGSWTITQTPPGGNPATISNNIFDATSSDVGTYQLEFQLNNAQPPGCPTTFFVNVDVDQFVEAGMEINAPSYCSSEMVETDLNSLIINADPGGVWSETSANPSQFGAFDPVNGTFASQNQDPGIYTFEYLVASTNSCPDDLVEVSVTVNAVPTSFVNDGSLINCANTSTMLDAGGSNGPAYSINWDGPGIVLDGNETTFNPTVNASGVYIMTVTDITTGCTSQAWTQVTEDFDPPQAFGGIDQMLDCNETTTTLQASGDIDPPFQITWTGPGIDFSNINSPAPEVDLPGIYTITIFNPDNGCTSQIDTVIVNQDIDPPSIVIQSPLEEIDCNSPTADLIADSNTPNVSYEWFDPQSTSIGNTPEINGITEAGTYTLILTNNSTGCTSTESIQVVDNTDYPDAEAGPPSLINCIDTDITLDGSGSESGPDITYNWDGPGVSGPQDQVQSMANIPGTYTITVTNNANGCTSTDQVMIGQDIQAPTVVIAQPEQLDCTIEEVSLDGTGSSNGPTFTYTWTNSAGDFLSAGTTVNVQNADTYTLTILNTENGCESSEVVQVLENTDVPSAANIEVINPDCFGESSGFISIIDVTGGTAPYVYSINGAGFITNPIFGNLSPGSFTIGIQDANGCEFETTVTVVEPPQIQIDLGADLEVRLGDSSVVEAVLNIPPNLVDTIIWSPADIITCNDPACLEVGLSTFNTVTVSATVIDINGCTDTDDVIVQYRKNRSVFIPTAFSPDGDGFNDNFTIYVNEAQVVNIPTFRIFNRWGEVVFEGINFTPNDESNGWDGTFKNERMNPGVFVYYAEIEFIDGRKQLYKGSVTLLK